MPHPSSPGRSIRDDIETVLVTEQEIDEAVEEIADRLAEDVGELNPILVGTLTGAFVFLADLVRKLDFPLEVDFMTARSYGDCTEAGELDVICDLTCDITGRHVVIVDDIADSGQTLKALMRMLRERGAASVRSCCLLDKPARRTCNFRPDYVGVTIPDRFVVGYGLDFAGHHRNLPFVGVLRPELYQTNQQ